LTSAPSLRGVRLTEDVGGVFLQLTIRGESAAQLLGLIADLVARGELDTGAGPARFAQALHIDTAGQH
jgi:hypothetical protein